MLCVGRMLLWCAVMLYCGIFESLRPIVQGRCGGLCRCRGLELAWHVPAECGRGLFVTFVCTSAMSSCIILCYFWCMVLYLLYSLDIM